VARLEEPHDDARAAEPDGQLTAPARALGRVLVIGAVLAASSQGAQARARPAKSTPPIERRPHLVLQAGGSEVVTSVGLSPNGRWVVTGSADGAARIWDLESEMEIRSLVGHLEIVNAVAFSPDGRRVLTGSEDGTAKIWDTGTGRELRSFRGHANRVTSVAFCADGRRALTAGHDGTARLWDVETGTELRAFPADRAWVGSVAVSADQRRVLTGGYEGTARLWDVETGRELRTFMGHSRPIESVALSPDGRYVLTGSADGTARLWDAETGKELRTLARQSSDVRSVAFSPSGRQAVTGSLGTATLWEVETGRNIRSFKGHWSGITSLTFSSNGRTLLTGGFDGTARLWDVETALQLHSFTGRSSGEVTSLAFSPDGQRVVTGDKLGAAQLWDAQTGRQVRSFAGHQVGITGVAFSRDGARVLTGSFDNTARIWDASTGKELQRFTGHAGGVGVESVAFSPDGKRVLAGSSDTTAMLWDTGTGRELRTFRGHTGVVATVSFSPDGRRALTGGFDCTAKLWDIETGKELRTIGRYPDPFNAILSPDGRLVLGGGKVVTLWDAETGKELHTFVGHSDQVWSVAFSSDSRRAVTGSNDRTAKLWDLETGRELRSFVGHRNRIATVALSPDGRLLLTGSDDYTTKLWDAETGNCLATLVSFTDGTWAVVDPAGRYDGSNDGNVEGLHWVVGDTPIALSQLKERYYEPGLLAKAMGFAKDPLRPVERLETPELFPLVELAPPAPGATTLRIHLKDQGGGIGRVRVLVNGKEIAADARGPGPHPKAAESWLEVSLIGPAVKPGRENRVEVLAWNAEGYLSSRGVGVTWWAPGVKDVVPPQVFAIVSGTARYASPSMNLTFPGKDAADMATAMEVAARRLFGAEKVHLALLTDYPAAKGALPPTRDNLRAAFEAARKAKPDDILVVYLSGHGTTAPDGEYWYLTREARSTDLSDPQVRELSGVSSAELAEWIKAVPVTKQVLILDTCAAGAAAAKLTEPRALPSDQVRAIARLKDRTGLHVLMGSAADAASYEATRYGQGLLTYALLEGMRGAALRDDAFVDVGRLFGHAVEEVPELARSIGGIQSPIIAAPKGASFDIGQVASEDKPLIPLAIVRPMLLRASFQREEPPFTDSLDLSRQVNAALRDAADPAARGGRIAFVDGDELPGALRLTGRYREVGDRIHVDAYLADGKTSRAHFELDGRASDPAALAAAVVKKAEEQAGPSAP
jgi:WD40 repeat protein